MGGLEGVVAMATVRHHRSPSLAHHPLPNRFGTGRFDVSACVPVVAVPLKPVRYEAAKRVVDILVALAGIVILSPILIVVGALVWLTSPGPMVFRQTRVGRGGRLFTCFKFRTMCADAEDRRELLLPLNEASGPVFKIKNDPRITFIGRTLRRYSLDELPQIFNVLRGEMSIVGPRPPLPVEVLAYNARERERLSVLPGLTCYWQISGRSDIPFEHWMEMDLLYIETMSFWTDLAIIARTFPAVCSARGAR